MHSCAFSSHLQMYKTLHWLIASCQEICLDLKTLINLLFYWSHIKEHDIHYMQYISLLLLYSHPSYTMHTEQVLILNFIYLPILDNFHPRGFITDPVRWKKSQQNTVHTWKLCVVKYSCHIAVLIILHCWKIREEKSIVYFLLDKNMLLIQDLIQFPLNWVYRLSLISKGVGLTNSICSVKLDIIIPSLSKSNSFLFKSDLT